MLWLFIRAILSPSHSATLVAILWGRPEIADDLRAICHRESRCQRVSVHERDAWISDREWRGQVKLGHLDPECQPWAPEAWATRGAWGLSAGAHWAYLPPCYPPWVFDLPLVSAAVAAQKYVTKCLPKRKRKGWCRVPTEAWRTRKGRRA